MTESLTVLSSQWSQGLLMSHGSLWLQPIKSTCGGETAGWCRLSLAAN